MMFATLVWATLGQAPPITVPLEVLGDECAVRVRIDGKERRVLLTTASANSYLAGTSDQAVEVEVGGRSLGKIRFLPPREGSAVSGEDGGIGTSFLKKMVIGLDPIKRQATLWPKGSLGPGEAEAWVQALPPAGRPTKALRLSTRRLPGGAPSVEATIGGKKMPLVLRLGFNGSFLEPSIERPAIPIGRMGSLLPPVSLAGSPPNWLFYRPALALPLDAKLFGVHGALTLDAFCSRRILVDFAGESVTIEDAPSGRRASEFLTTFSRVPLEVKDKGIFVEFPGGEGTEVLPTLVPFVGSQVLRIADDPAGGWQSDLMGSDETAAKSLASRLAKLFGSFRIDVLTSEGRELPIDVNN